MNKIKQEARGVTEQIIQTQDGIVEMGNYQVEFNNMLESIQNQFNTLTAELISKHKQEFDAQKEEYLAEINRIKDDFRSECNLIQTITQALTSNSTDIKNSIRD